ncbi:hypothetical protein ACA910_010042 [Epithemia clementina (nom. ined.)]
MAPRSKIIFENCDDTFDDMALIGVFDVIHEQDVTMLIDHDENIPDDGSNYDSNDLMNLDVLYSPVLLAPGQQQQQQQEPTNSNMNNNTPTLVPDAAAAWNPPPPTPPQPNNSAMVRQSSRSQQETEAMETGDDWLRKAFMNNENEEDTDSIEESDERMIVRSSAFDEGDGFKSEGDDDEEDEDNYSDESNHGDEEDDDNNTSIHHPLNEILAMPDSDSTIRSRPSTSSPCEPWCLFDLNPETITLQDLERFAEEDSHFVPSLVEYIYHSKSPRLICLILRLLMCNAKAAKNMHWFTTTSCSNTNSHTNAPIVLELATSSLANCQDWLGQECAGDLIRTLSAHSAMDPYLLKMDLNLLPILALVAQGGFLVGCHAKPEPHPLWTLYPLITTPVGEFIVTEHARIHACVALLNLSCGSLSCKTILAHSAPLMQGLKTILLDPSDDVFRIKAVTIIKNLSSLDSNDAAIVQYPGLLHALGQILWESTISQLGPRMGEIETSSAECLAQGACVTLMNLSISKHFKYQIFKAPGVVPALLTILEKKEDKLPLSRERALNKFSKEARLQACTVLSNLAIGYSVKSPMLQYPGFVDAILRTLATDEGEIQSKAGSILWSLAAEKKNQAALVQRGDVLPVLIHVASSCLSNTEMPSAASATTSQKCVAAMALLAESPDNAVPLLHASVLRPVLHILDLAGSDPTQWKDPTASWCITCLLNLAQVDAAVPFLRNAGVVSLLAPLVMVDYDYQSLKAAMTLALCCRRLQSSSNSDEDYQSVVSYDLLRKIETTVPQIVHLMYNTIAGRGGDGYKYGVFTLSSIMACIAALMSGPEFIQERICTHPVMAALLKVLWDFCVNGGAPGTIVGGGQDDIVSASWAVKALHSGLVYLSSTANMGILQPILRPLIQTLSDVEHRFVRVADTRIVNDGSNIYFMVQQAIHLVSKYWLSEQTVRPRMDHVPSSVTTCK